MRKKTKKLIIKGEDIKVCQWDIKNTSPERERGTIARNANALDRHNFGQL